MKQREDQTTEVGCRSIVFFPSEHAGVFCEFAKKIKERKLPCVGGTIDGMVTVWVNSTIRGNNVARVNSAIRVNSKVLFCSVLG